jgi:hypothetical protein
MIGKKHGRYGLYLWETISTCDLTLAMGLPVFHVPLSGYEDGQPFRKHHPSIHRFLPVRNSGSLVSVVDETN